jgi:hypothetical protein
MSLHPLALLGRLRVRCLRWAWRRTLPPHEQWLDEAAVSTDWVRDHWLR